jgi:hypothetical protein
MLKREEHVNTEHQILSQFIPGLVSRRPGVHIASRKYDVRISTEENNAVNCRFYSIKYWSLLTSGHLGVKR